MIDVPFWPSLPYWPALSFWSAIVMGLTISGLGLVRRRPSLTGRRRHPDTPSFSAPDRGMSRELLKLSGSLVHDDATISDDSPSPNRASRAKRAATSAGIS